MQPDLNYRADDYVDLHPAVRVSPGIYVQVQDDGLTYPTQVVDDGADPSPPIQAVDRSPGKLVMSGSSSEFKVSKCVLLSRYKGMVQIACKSRNCLLVKLKLKHLL